VYIILASNADKSYRRTFKFHKVTRLQT